MRVVSYPSFLDFRERTRSFSAFMAFSGETFAIGGIDSPELARGQFVTGEYFEALGVPAAPGRTLNTQDANTARPVAVISDRLWHRRFARGAAKVEPVVALRCE